MAEWMLNDGENSTETQLTNARKMIDIGTQNSSTWNSFIFSICLRYLFKLSYTTQFLVCQLFSIYLSITVCLNHSQKEFQIVCTTKFHSTFWIFMSDVIPKIIWFSKSMETPQTAWWWESNVFHSFFLSDSTFSGAV